METKQYTYYAFISYRGADVKWAKWFVKKADNYLLPTVTPDDVKAGNRAPMRLKDDDKYLYPVFRDRDNLKSGKLLDQILASIDVSRKIVVLCTPTAAQKGSWMDDELRHIIKEGRVEHLIPLVVEGRVYSIEEYEAAGRAIDDPFPDDCNPYVLRQYMKDHREHAAAINYIEFVEQGVRNPERAFIKCVASIIDMPFEDLWDRFGKEQKRKKLVRRLAIGAAVVATAIVGLGTWWYNQPVDVQAHLNETSVHNDNLPALKDAIVTLTIDNETKRDTLASLDDAALFANIPHDALGKEAHITVECKDWLTADTTIVLAKDMTINIARDPHPYGDIQFMLWNPNTERTYPGITVTIRSASGRLLCKNGHEATADAEGRIRYTMALAEQDTFYIVKAPMPLENDTLDMPTTESAVILAK